MSKPKAIVLAFLALVVGVAAGGLGAYRIMSEFMEKTLSATSAAEVTSAVGALKQLRAENTTGAVESLEMSLDGALITLGAFLHDAPEPPDNALASALKSIEMAQKYRIEYPRTNSLPEISEQVAKAFGELDKYSAQ